MHGFMVWDWLYGLDENFLPQKQMVGGEEVSALRPGQVRVSGDVWTAAPYDETLRIAAGETVEVLQIRGATAYVHPVPRLEP